MNSRRGHRHLVALLLALNAAAHVLTAGSLGGPSLAALIAEAPRQATKPGAAQTAGTAPSVSYSRSGGTFTSPFPLALSCRSTSAVIRYTLDGKLPTRNSAACSAPLTITNTACVRAQAFEDGLLPGPPHSETYVLLHTNALAFASTLPVLIMHTLGREEPASPRATLVHLSLYEPVQGRTSLTNAPTFASRGGFHVRGSSSSGMPQSSFALQFLDEHNAEEDRSILGLPADSDWVLYAPNGFEPVMIHNPFVHQLSRDLGRYSPRTRFLEVFLARNRGPVTARDYHGLYVLEEKIKIGPHRVAIDRLKPSDLTPPAVTGGYLLKVDRVGPGEGGFGAAGASMVYVDPKEAVIARPERKAQGDYLHKFFAEFDQALHSAHWKDPVRGYRAFVDVDSWIDYHVLEVLSGNVDTLVLSTYFYKPRNGKLTFGPHWDFDRALGSTDGRDDNPRHWNTGPFFDAPWWNRLFSDSDFWQKWVDRWQELRATHFALANLNLLIDQLTDELREAQPRQVKRWGLHPRGGTYQGEIRLMKDWLSNRVDFIDRQLVPPPRLSHAGGAVEAGLSLTLQGPTNATIYYMLDGSDPRLSQGAVSSNALVYTTSIRLDSNARLFARAHNPKQRQHGGPPTSTPWSSPVSATFTITPRKP